jgi:periplasmic divalent cation tolerance protein
MKMYYVTLNNDAEAKTISFDLLEQKVAICTNWFPITCAYRWEGEIKHEQEVVLIIKTKENMREKIETIISSHIDYLNYIAELDVHSVNAGYLNWVNTEIS